MGNKKISQYEKETTREVNFLGKTFRVRKIPPTPQARKALGRRSKREIISHFPIQPLDLQRKFKKKRSKILQEMALMHPEQIEQFIAKGPIDFLEDKGDRKKYHILCATCGDKVAYVWAKDQKLTDWADLHYICWYDRESWRGAMAINVSPVDGALGIECACGEDTREFRVNKTLAPIQRNLMSEYSLKHRDFATPDSRFVAVQL